MAYVLGVIYTDGNLRPGILRDPTCSDTLSVGRLTVSQKEPELLEKILQLMTCNARLLTRKRQVFENTVAGQIYYFHINNDAIYDDLIRCGLFPNKSLIINFPECPGPFLRHFIRGCWDGDGSVYVDKKSGQLRASFVSGSYNFITGIQQENLSDKKVILFSIFRSGLHQTISLHVRRRSGRTILNTEISHFQFCIKKSRILIRGLYMPDNTETIFIKIWNWAKVNDIPN
jgi:hypothetical protein